MAEPAMRTQSGKWRKNAGPAIREGTVPNGAPLGGTVSTRTGRGIGELMKGSANHSHKRWTQIER